MSITIPVTSSVLMPVMTRNYPTGSYPNGWRQLRRHGKYMPHQGEREINRSVDQGVLEHPLDRVNAMGTGLRLSLSCSR